jgi:hypothetical protein
MNTLLTTDTETCSLTTGIYDIAYAIHSKDATFTTVNYLVEEIMTNPDMARKAYFQKKHYTKYIPMLSEGKIKLKPWNDIMAEMLKSIRAYKIDTICAYNLAFDMRAIKNTDIDINGELTDTVKEILALKKLCIWNFICESVLKSRNYKKIAIQNGWISPAGNVKTGAEFAFRYISENPDFEESHTALEDVLIEIELLQKCFNTRKKIPYNKINTQCWKIVNPLAKKDSNVHGNKVA